ncbi:hypothetical protein ACFUIW_02135 [Streptomyces sp. NPDC057245]|uniref:hypothetical protein n=1 Tax=Streptomyces TaxID=1883 RepID=UPI001C1E14B5|nr:hypothetical protein [Streptomyces sp. A108]MBU6531689.1 hypothetical protein [Streptomyces sp. A108]
MAITTGTTGTKRRNAVLGLYDSPLHRDWAFWMTSGWGVLTGLAIGTSDEPRTMPAWLDTSLAALTFAGLFGVLPSWIRLLFRRWRARRRRRARQASVGTHAGAASSAPRPPEQPFLPPPRSPGPGQAPPADGSGGTRARGATAGGAEDTTLSVSTVLARARSTMPHPVARAVRTLQQAHSSKGQYEAVLDAAETLAICVSVTSAALLRKYGESSAPGAGAALHHVSLLRGALLGRDATFGTWTNWLQEVSHLANSHPTTLPTELGPLSGDSHGPLLVEHLNALRAERNRAAHGDRPQSTGESALRVREMRPHLEQALVKAGFLTRTPWLLTVTSSYRPATRTFDVEARDATGDHPDFERRKFNWAEPVATNVFHVLDAGVPVMLTPFVASRFCPQCGQDEVCYAVWADKADGPAKLKSFARGHTLHAADLGDEIRSLPASGRGTG